MDIVYIRDLNINAVIGIFPWERQIKQAISIDIEMATDVKAAAKNDDINHALDYKAIAKSIIAYTEQSRFNLVETLAENIAEKILVDFGVRWLRLRVSKPGAIRGSKDVGVMIERGQQA